MIEVSFFDIVNGDNKLFPWHLNLDIEHHADTRNRADNIIGADMNSWFLDKMIFFPIFPEDSCKTTRDA